jgi:deoxyribodipyrimidine photo-lyase
VFVFDDAILAPLPRGDRRVQFIHASVIELDGELRRLGGSLSVLHGNAADEIVRLAAALGVDAVFVNEDYEPQARARDAQVAARLRADGRTLLSYKDQVIFDKHEVLTLGGQPFSVFTPFRNAWLKRLAADPGCLAPWPVEQYADRLAPSTGQRPLALAALGFEPGRHDEPGLAPGMAGAAQLFERFIPQLAAYGMARDYPEHDGTSHLSIHLRFGTLSVRHLVRTLQQLAANGAGGAGAAIWLSELIWREFYMMILYHHPRVVERSFKPAFDAIAWETGAQAQETFSAWCEGRTGYPLVDAAMLQLERTGFMHNRLRMVTASFLVKDLGIDWRWGERHFARHLNDYELASNNGGWQWAASTGCDAQPWFRIFNPVTQSQKFDADGAFIGRFLPQLARLDAKQIHAPWLVAPETLARLGVRLGQDYPEPIVVHEQARQRTLARFAVVKAG